MSVCFVSFFLLFQMKEEISFELGGPVPEEGARSLIISCVSGNDAKGMNIFHLSLVLISTK